LWESLLLCCCFTGRRIFSLEALHHQVQVCSFANPSSLQIVFSASWNKCAVRPHSVAVRYNLAVLSASPRASVVDYRTLPSSCCEIQSQPDDTAIYTINSGNPVSRQIHTSTCQLFCTVSDPLPFPLPSDVRKPQACRACGPAERCCCIACAGP
jgi:hypothetical protein